MSAPTRAPLNVEMALELCAGCNQPLPVVDVEAGETTHANCESPPPGERRSGPGATNARTAETSTRALTHREVTTSVPRQGASFDLLQAGRHERRVFWWGYETGHRHGLADGYADGHTDGHRAGWVDRDAASLEAAAEHRDLLSSTAGPSEAELRARRAEVDRSDVAWRCQRGGKAELIAACFRSWGEQP